MITNSQSLSTMN